MGPPSEPLTETPCSMALALNSDPKPAQAATAGSPRTLALSHVNIIRTNTNGSHPHCLKIDLSSRHADYRVRRLIFQAAHGTLTV